MLFSKWMLILSNVFAVNVLASSGSNTKQYTLTPLIGDVRSTSSFQQQLKENMQNKRGAVSYPAVVFKDSDMETSSLNSKDIEQRKSSGYTDVTDSEQNQKFQQTYFRPNSVNSGNSAYTDEGNMHAIVEYYKDENIRNNAPVFADYPSIKVLTCNTCLYCLKCRHSFPIKHRC
jgi:hypothetical protein